MDVHLLLAFVVACALISIVPGPDMLFIVANGAAGGRRAGALAALGASTGLAVHTTAAALGLGALVRAAPVLLDAVRWAGAGFLLYLAVRTWWSTRRRDEPTGTVPGTDGEPALPAGPVRSLRRTYAMAVLTNVANPKVILFYLAFLPQFVTSQPGAWPVTGQLFALGLTLIVVGLSVDLPVGLLSGAVADRFLRRGRLRRWLDRAVAVVFGGLAVRLLADTR